MHPFALSSTDLMTIKEKLAAKKALAKGRSQVLFDVLDGSLCPEEQVALEFLFAFMPLVDLADYSGELFLKHVRHSLRAIKEAPWGKTITGQLFLHYILPYRISNETIEDYRPYFWNALFDRVKDLSMADAILETNHWCHEKATYIASDPRTASPLTLVRTARGRCGEESTLLVAALRSLGIPARQVYAPRWAHTDSNHAWVEAWADGEWFFLGACEPEPRLNMGWFEGPARRGMLLHTRVPGTIYTGPEEVVQVTDEFTELNLLPNYAPIQDLTVQVQDMEGHVVVGADVDLQVFNYGGFASLARLKTDQEGKVQITTGRGDLLIHASKEQAWGSVLANYSAGGNADENVRTLELVLGPKNKEFQQFSINVPPHLLGKGLEIHPWERERNDARLKAEDKIRSAYEATFVAQEQGVQTAKELGVDPEKVWTVLEKARGNSHAILDYLKQAVPEFGPMALELVGGLSAKDLTDTTTEILLDHLQGTLPYEELYPQEEFVNYILQPRITHEQLRGYRAFFQQHFTLDAQEICRHNPPLLKAWIDENITDVADGSVGGWPSPQGVYELGVGNDLARQILFVAMARSFGIPARLSPVDGELQYLHEETWTPLDLQDRLAGSGAIRILKPTEYTGTINYFQNFSLARLEDGFFKTLRFRGLDEETFNEENFNHELQLRAGVYRITTGNRLADGRVLATLKIFAVEPGKMCDVQLVLAQETVRAESLGDLPEGLRLKRYGAGGDVDLDDLRKNGALVLAWIDPDREPTKHLIRDLTERRRKFDALNVSIILCLGADTITDSFDLANYGALPANAHFVKDWRYEVLEHTQRSLQDPMPRSFPMVVVADEQGVVRYVSTGYQIGTGGQILEHVQKG